MGQAFDGDPNTHWQSGSALPYGFLGVPSQNVAFGCAGDALTDGDLNTAIELTGTRRVELREPQGLTSIAVKASARGTLTLKLVGAAGQTTELATLTAADDYQTRTFAVPAGDYVGIDLTASGGGAQVFEVGALAAEVYEWVGARFAEPRAVGQVWLRTWPGPQGAVTTVIEGTVDGERWDTLRTLAADALATRTILLDEEVELRGIRVAHRVEPADWGKVFIWEVQVYDRYGPYGPIPDRLDEPVTFNEMLGVNGIWGWGYNQFSDQLSPAQGPARFAKVFAKARAYHNLDWDVRAPGNDPNYAQMARGRGTEAMDWVNWDREYMDWRRDGLEVNPTVRITMYGEDQWTDPAAQAERWGRAFGEHFGHGLIGSVEVGNEPWTFTAPTYRAILEGAVRGLTATASDSMLILPCALQAVDSATEQTSHLKNYIGGRISPAALAGLDGLNAHTYAFRTNLLGTRTITYPEDPLGAWGELHNMLRWRNANAPEIPVYLTEFGYDSPGAGDDCTFSECITEEAAAAYTLRSALIANRLGLRRTDYYFYGNTDGDGIFTRSGLVGRPAEGAEEKLTFAVLAQLHERLGGYRVVEVLQEDEDAYVYALADGAGERVLVAWSPTALDAGPPAGEPAALRGKAAVETFAPGGAVRDGLSPWPQIYALGG